MLLDLTDEEAAALLKELNQIIDNDRYPLSRRIGVLRSIRAKFPTATRTTTGQTADARRTEPEPTTALQSGAA